MRYLLLFTTLFVTGLSQAQTLNTFDSNVSEVTVYNRGALVTRKAKVTFTEGQQEIELTGFPADIDINSLRIEVADKAVQLGQVRTQKNVLRDAKSVKVQELEAKILAKKTDIQAVADSTKAAELQLRFLDSLASGYAKDAWVGASTANADTASWQNALSLMQQGSLSAFEIVRDNKLKSVELNKDLQALTTELEAQRDPTKANSSLLLSTTSQASISTDVRVYYFRNQAGWSPAYEARLDTDDGSLTLSQKAGVWQSTTEPWQGVELTLASSRPSQNMQPPVMASQFYDLFDPRPIYSGGGGGGGLEEVIVTASRVDSDVKRQRKQRYLEDGFSEVADAQAQWQGEYAQSFNVAGLVDISNNRDQAQRFDIRSYQFEAELVTQIAPMVDKQAYLSARIKHDGNTPIYGSSMQVYSDGTLMGAAVMPTILPGKETVLPMGVDQQIEVNIIDQAGLSGEGGIISKSINKRVDLTFEIRNRRRSASEIEVRAVYPTAKHRSLKMKIDSKATPPTLADEEDKKGVYLWSKKLAGNDVWKIDFAYSLTYPAAKTLGVSY